jgi:Ribonuclease G/E
VTDHTEADTPTDRGTHQHRRPHHRQRRRRRRWPHADPPAWRPRPRGRQRRDRTRDRLRRPFGGESLVSASSADAGAADGDDAGASDGGTGDGGTGGKRRRRGRRGRGRGRGRSAEQTDRTEGADDTAEAGAPTATTAEAEEAAESPRDGADAPKDGAARKGRQAPRDASEGKGRSPAPAGKDGERARKDGKDGKGADDPDRDVAAAIAKGGTRMAAKGRGRRDNGGGRGRSNQRPGGVPEEVRRAILEGPPRTMLVTNREDRTQIAVLEDRTVCEHYVTRKKDVTFVGNIYMARVQNVLPGMEAAFLDIGKGRNGVLYAGEVLYDELDLEEGADQRIENVLKPGQKVLVQVTKDPMGSKGPRLTMHLSLAGRYSVLAPNSDLFGISRKLTDKERDRLRRIVKKVKPEHHGVIVRTAAENASEDQLTADLERLLGKWAKVEEAAEAAKAMSAVYEEPPLVVKVIRDNFGPEFERCIVDDEDLFHQVRGYLDEVAPELTSKVELYGQPTADARARAAGAPSVEEASADPATADTATAQATEDLEEAAAPAMTEAGDAEPTEAPVEGDTSAPETTAVATVVDLEAARTRRESLPRLFDAYDVTDQLRKATVARCGCPPAGT